MRIPIYFIVLMVLQGCYFESDLEVSNGKRVNISFDDGVSLESLHANLDLLESYNVKVTYFVSNIELILTQVDKLNDLVDAGHEIGVHGYNHFGAISYIEEHGLNNWLQDEVLRPKYVLDSLGINTTTFSYPGGSRSIDTDQILMQYFSKVRGFKNDYDYFTPSNDSFLIEGFSIDSHNFDLSKISLAFNELKNGETLFLATHMIRDFDSNDGTWYILRSNLDAILQIGLAKEIKFVTIADV